jgi:serine protease AprX
MFPLRNYWTAFLWILSLICLILMSMLAAKLALAQGPEAEPTKVAPIIPVATPEIDISGPEVNIIIFLKAQPLQTTAASIKDGYRPQLTHLSDQIQVATSATARPLLATTEEERAAVQAEPSLKAAQVQQIRAWAEEMDTLTRQMRRDIVQAAQPDIVASQADLVQFINSVGGTVLNQLITVNAVAAILPTSQLEALKNRPDIAKVIPNEITQGYLDTSTASIGAPDWWANGYTGGAWDIGVVDSGIDDSHPAFDTHTFYQQRFGTAADVYPAWGDCPNWDPSNDDPTTDDVNGHGTHIAGIVASDDSTYQGVAYGLDSIINVKAGFHCPDNGRPYALYSDVMSGVDWSYNTAGDDADVLNFSYGGATSDDYPDYARFWDAVIDGLDMPVAIAAGNDGPTIGTVASPSTGYNVISVANIDDQNNTDRSNDVIANSSSRGPSPSGRKKPDLAAPGTSIRSADNNWEDLGGLIPDWDTMSGTSMAAPHVAGALVLLMDYGVYNPMAQKAILINTAEDLGDADWDNAYGWGYLDLTHAYYHRSDYFLASVPHTDPDFKFYKGAAFTDDTATLVWNRRVTYNGSNYPDAPPALSDLDLYLFDESNGNELDGSFSVINNVEQVKADANYSDVVLKVDAYGTFDGTTTESFALATEEGFSAVSGPAFTLGTNNYTPLVGNQFIASVTVQNTGDLNTHNVNVSLNLPPGLILVSGPNPQNIGTINQGASKIASWTLRTDQAGNYNVPVNVTSYSYYETFSAAGSFSVNVGSTPSGDPIDVYLLVDLTGSFYDDLPVFKAQAATVISTLTASNSNIRFGLGKFEDYPIYPFGVAAYGDEAYERLADLTFDTNLVLNAINGLSTQYGKGWDTPESQLPALYQTATGAGQNLSGVGYPGASIPAGQQANFRSEAAKLIILWTDAPFHRPGDPGDIPYPGPGFAETANAINSLGDAFVLGVEPTGVGTTAVSSSSQQNLQPLKADSISAASTSDLVRMVSATGAFAGDDGVDCDDDGTIDIHPGQPLVCTVGSAGEGIGEAIISLVEAERGPARVFLPFIMKN